MQSGNEGTLLEIANPGQIEFHGGKTQGNGAF
jgi:hypothetical protein